VWPLALLGLALLVYGAAKGSGLAVSVAAVLVLASSASLLEGVSVEAAVAIVQAIMLCMEAVYLFSRTRGAVLMGGYARWRLAEVAIVMAASLVASLSITAIGRYLPAMGFEFVEVALLSLLLVILAREAVAAGGRRGARPGA